MKTFRWLAAGLALGALASLAPSCGPGACGPSTCFGCCDLSGQCQSGTEVAACGTAGAACASCGSAEACATGQCLPTLENSGTDGGTDGGTNDPPTAPLAFTASTIPATPVLGSNTMIVTIKGANGVPVTGTSLSARTYMPAMGHGSATPTCSETGNGVYKITGVSFTMSGGWTVTLTATGPGSLSGSQTFSYSVH